MKPAIMLIAALVMLVPLGAEASPKDKDRWNEKYATDRYIFGKEPIPFLKQHVDLLPKGKALDIAMGEGRNGVFLATRGFQVTGIDISQAGLQKARTLAAAHNVSIETRMVDLEGMTLEQNAYDVIVMSYYMQRDLFPQIKAALKPGGMAVVETYNVGHLKYRPTFTRQYLLDTNELLHRFKDCTIIRYQAYDDGEESYSSIIVQKP
jgi:2-polyprenyl-3-methyl-5-hydroxy-6-metoxy-1,4-benzoquinol methylase